MPVKIDINKPQVLAKIGVAWDETMKPLAEEILADCNEYCKMDTGNLIASSLIHSQLDKGLLVWATPYAARQYYAIRTASHDKNPMAVWRWAAAARNNRLERWKQQAQRLMEMNL